MKTKTIKNSRNGTPPTTIRCAVYTRKSTEDGLEQAFNSLDAQRECGESYIRSLSHEGWVCVPEQFDDGGYSGGILERPALQRLLREIEAGRVNVVVVYKIDRLSRCLLHFMKLMETFDKHKVSFVAVTQRIDTSSSMGRLMLQILMSFAEFERSMISERTRDKIAAARRKGKWSGGQPLLGYDLTADSKLVVNKAEAAQIRAIFDLYLQNEALLPVVQELDRRKWTNKRWITRKGKETGGGPLVKTNLHRLLTNPAYIGKVRHKDEVYDGEHEAILAPEVFTRVQEILARNGSTGGAKVRNKFGAVLKGLIRCTPCDCSMTPAHTTKGKKRYRYYCCTAAQKKGWGACPSKSIPAAQIEKFVLDRIRAIGQDPALWRETLAQARSQADEDVQALESERHGLERDLKHWNKEVPLAEGSRLAELTERIETATARVGDINHQIRGLRATSVTESEVAQALAKFDPIWENLTPREQTRLVELLVERVDYDGGRKKISITFQATGIRTLAHELKETA